MNGCFIGLLTRDVRMSFQIDKFKIKKISIKNLKELWIFLFKILKSIFKTNRETPK